MSQAEIDLVELRQVRDAAKASFDARMAMVKGDLAARGVGGRIADKLGDDARQLADEALDIASESKGIIAGTLAALTLWLLRNPIIDKIEALLSAHEGMEK